MLARYIQVHWLYLKPTQLLILNTFEIKFAYLISVIYCSKTHLHNLFFPIITMFCLPERKSPVISIQKQIVDGAIYQVNCSVNYSCPFTPPSLHWNKSPSLDNCTLMAFDERVQGQWLYTETLQGQATYDMHNSKMRCSAQFSAFTTSQQITVIVLCKWYSLLVQNTVHFRSTFSCWVCYRGTVLLF